MKRVFSVIILSISILACHSGIMQAQTAQDISSVRVLIADDLNFVKIYAGGEYTISSLATGKTLLSGPRIETKVVSVKEGLFMRERQFDCQSVRISTGPDAKIFLDKRPFRGSIDIIKKPNGKLMVINTIGLEEYLYGVLYNEVSHRWPMEALKAQAIAARTFAFYQASQNRAQPYDLRNDVYSQVYSGSDFERWSTRTAVDVTKGKVLTYAGELLPAYYHAACSGGTEDASVLWNVDIPPLKGVECDYCKDSKYYKWIKDIPLWTVEKKLNGAGRKTGKIVSVKVITRNKSGRVERLSITDAEGRSMDISGKDFRQILGPNELRSAKFEVSVLWGQLIVEGRGWGHGVGMCQWGVYGQAKLGKKADEMLKYYYPGAEITTIDKLKK